MKRGILITALGATAFLLLSGFGGCGRGSGLGCGSGSFTSGSISLTVIGRGGVTGSGARATNSSAASRPACASATPASDARDSRAE